MRNNNPLAPVASLQGTLVGVGAIWCHSLRAFRFLAFVSCLLWVDGAMYNTSNPFDNPAAVAKKRNSAAPAKQRGRRHQRQHQNQNRNRQHKEETRSATAAKEWKSSVPQNWPTYPEPHTSYEDGAPPQRAMFKKPPPRARRTLNDITLVQVSKQSHPELIETRLAPIFKTLETGFRSYVQSREGNFTISPVFRSYYIDVSDMKRCSNASRTCVQQNRRGLARSFKGTKYLELGELKNVSNLWQMFNAGSMLIFVGEGLNMVPWKYLRDRDVYTVYYQIEPMRAECGEFDADHARVAAYWGQIVSNVAEIWDYSWMNIDYCERIFYKDYRAALANRLTKKPYPGFRPALRFVPPGYFTDFFPQVVHHEDCGRPVFVGAVTGRPCWHFLDDWVKPQQRAQTIARLAIMFENNSIYITPYKRCDIENPYDRSSGLCTAVRFAMLLNAGAIAIAQHCYWKDELEFKGLISFLDIPEMRGEFDRLKDLPIAQREWYAMQRQALFKERFSPEALFERAGIHRLLDMMTTRPHVSTSF